MLPWDITSFSTASQAYKHQSFPVLRLQPAPAQFSAVRVSKILIYVNTDYHKLRLSK